MAKTYTITKSRDRGTPVSFTGTIEELTNIFSYTLECGASYQFEKGNSKINRKPTTIVSLVSNLNKAVNNSAANGYAGISFKQELTTLPLTV